MCIHGQASDYRTLLQRLSELMLHVPLEIKGETVRESVDRIFHFVARVSCCCYEHVRTQEKKARPDVSKETDTETYIEYIYVFLYRVYQKQVKRSLHRYAKGDDSGLVSERFS